MTAARCVGTNTTDLSLTAAFSYACSAQETDERCTAGRRQLCRQAAASSQLCKYLLLNTSYLIKIQLFWPAHRSPQTCLSGPPTMVTASWQNLSQASDGAFLPIPIQTHYTPARCPAHLCYAVSYACSRPAQASSMYSATGLEHCVILNS